MGQISQLEEPTREPAAQPSPAAPAQVVALLGSSSSEAEPPLVSERADLLAPAQAKPTPLLSLSSNLRNVNFVFIY
jgi:hypothetical protein